MNARRDFLAFTAGAVAARTVLPLAAQVAVVNPDAALPGLLREYQAGRAAYLAHVEVPGGDPVNDALCYSYMDVFDRIQEAQPTTLAGLIVKARAAKVELATHLDGSEDPPTSVGEEVCRNIINDLLRIGGAA